MLVWSKISLLTGNSTWILHWHEPGLWQQSGGSGASADIKVESSGHFGWKTTSHLAFKHRSRHMAAQKNDISNNKKKQTTINAYRLIKRQNSQHRKSRNFRPMRELLMFCKLSIKRQTNTTDVILTDSFLQKRLSIIKREKLLFVGRYTDRLYIGINNGGQSVTRERVYGRKPLPLTLAQLLRRKKDSKRMMIVIIRKRPDWLIARLRNK